MNEQFDYAAFAAVTLTAAYSGNRKVLDCKYLPNLHLDFSYTPKTGQSNRILYIYIEVSNDGGATYYPITTKANLTTSIKVYDDLGIQFPGDGVSTGGTAYTGYNDFTIVGDKVRISVKESGSDNFGVVTMRAVVSNPN